MAREQDCKIGGYNASFPIDGHSIFGNRFYVAVEGNDTSFNPFKTCCAPYEVKLAGPCLMWCETDGDHTGMNDCWDRENFHPESSFGSEGSSGGMQSSTLGAKVGVIVGSIVAAALLGGFGYWVWRRKKRAATTARKDLAENGEVRAMERTEAVAGLPPYENFKYDLRVDKAERGDAKSLASEVSSLQKK